MIACDDLSGDEPPVCLGANELQPDDRLRPSSMFLIGSSISANELQPDDRLRPSSMFLIGSSISANELQPDDRLRREARKPIQGRLTCQRTSA